MSKTLFFSSGDKGGVGKSVVAGVVVDWLLASGKSVALIEGDVNMPDVGMRHADAPDLAIFKLPLNRAGDEGDAIARLSNWLEKNTAEYAVVNLPANASETLDAQAEILRVVCDAADYRMAAAWSLAQSEAAADALASSFVSGLLSFVEPENRLVLIPEFFGRPESFAFLNSDKKGDWLYHEAVMPKLAPSIVWEAVAKASKPFSTLATEPDQGLNIHGRIVLNRWLSASRNALSPLFPELPR